MSLAGRRLDGEVAYITGASSGIGAACALRLVEHGASVVLGARRQGRLAEVARACKERADGATVVALPLDVNDDASVDAFLAEGQRQAGSCTILVNNAGGSKGVGHVIDADPDDWDWTLDTNVRSLFRITQKVARGMVARDHGDIVMVASVAGVEPYAGGNVYSAAKAAVQAFATSLRLELLGKDIRVITLDPGLVETEFSLVRLGDVAKAKKVYEGLTPMTAEDVADCAAFALTRPRRMCVDRMLILATDQAGTRAIHRR